MKFYLGTHKTGWLSRSDVPLFVSDRSLAVRRTLPVATCSWALDSGGFSELHQHGRWVTTPAEYVARVRRYAAEVGRLDWVAPQDWMCEPGARAMTGLSVAEHQALTIDNFLRLRDQLGELVVPVLQGWERDDYLRHVDGYARHGVDLPAEAIVGVGSVCRRNAVRDIADVLVPLIDGGLRVHGFGVRGDVLAAIGPLLASADSLAWSYAARMKGRMFDDCTHQACNNCQRWALEWRRRTLAKVAVNYQPSLLIK